jgi:hypothetical protein
VKIYARKLDSAKARALILIRRHNADGRPFHAQDLLRNHKLVATGSGDLAKLRYWGFIAPVPKRDLPVGLAARDGKTSGFWRLLEPGILFADRRIRVPDTAFIKSGSPDAPPMYSDNLIDIVDALEQKFSYDELMRG